MTHLPPLTLGGKRLGGGRQKKPHRGGAARKDPGEDYLATNGGGGGATAMELSFNFFATMSSMRWISNSELRRLILASSTCLASSRPSRVRRSLSVRVWRIEASR